MSGEVRPAATIEQVAERAGVSRSTVSRVVNGSPAVSATALAAVERAIRELHYVPNRAARSLASRQTHALALIIPEETDRVFGDPFFAAIVTGISSRIAGTDYMLNLMIASDDEGAKTVGYLRSGSVDGAIVVSHHTSDTFIDRIAASLPLVYGGRPVRATGDDYYVDVDNVAGGRVATEHLLSTGARRIAVVSGPATMPAAVDRIHGCRDALAAAGLAPVAIEDGDFTESGGAAAMQRILASGASVDGLFAANDLMARGAMEVLRSAGLSVPADIGVVGYDDSPIAQSTTPMLTTVRQPSFHQGEVMASVLIDRLAGRRAEHATILPTELIVRESTRAAQG